MLQHLAACLCDGERQILGCCSAYVPVHVSVGLYAGHAACTELFVGVRLIGLV